WRGAYPFLGKLHPKLVRKVEIKREGLVSEEDLLDLLAGLAAEKEKTEKLLVMYEAKEKGSIGERKKYYAGKIKEARARLEEINAKIEEIEEKRNAEIYE
ncbi:MAG: hypothetical protein ACP5JR_01830, partial [Thermoplasmata archaeon]